MRMATLLYITAHPLTEAESFSLKVGRAFLDAYREAAPDDEIVRLDLYNMEIPLLDAAVLRGQNQLRNGAAFAQLPADAQRKIGRLTELADQFVAADKYVFVTPFWNLSFPPMMKVYIDAICVAGKTFKYTEAGPVGLLKNKRALHIQARGGEYSEGPAAEMEFGHRYLEALLHFFGIEQVEALIIEGHAHYPERADEILADALRRAPEMARRFAKPLAGVAL